MPVQRPPVPNQYSAPYVSHEEHAAIESEVDNLRTQVNTIQDRQIAVLEHQAKMQEDL